MKNEHFLKFETNWHAQASFFIVFIFSQISEIGGTGRSTVGNILAATKPDIIIEVDGDKYTLSTVTPLQSIKVSYTLNQEYEIELKKASDHTSMLSFNILVIITFMGHYNLWQTLSQYNTLSLLLYVIIWNHRSM